MTPAAIAIDRTHCASTATILSGRVKTSLLYSPSPGAKATCKKRMQERKRKQLKAVVEKYIHQSLSYFFL